MNFNFPDFSRSSVLVIGDVMLDRYYYGNTRGISPEAPVAVVNVNSIEDRPGGAANVAMNVAALGASSKLISIVGTDNPGKILREKLSLFNVDCNFVNSNYPTIIKLRVISHNQQLIRLDFEKQIEDIDIVSFMKQIKLALSHVNVLVLSDYDKGLLCNCAQEIITMARGFSIPVIVDPKGMNFSRYSGATLLTPNLSEFEVASNCYQRTEDVLVNRGVEIMLHHKLSAILITRSEHGMMLLQIGREPLRFSAKADKVYDVTGAGDTVVGVLAASLASGKNLEESCYLANLAAGLVVGKLGTSVVNVCELQNSMLPKYEDIVFGILDEKDLIKNVYSVRKKGERIVMTNGVFDILHAGHVAYLLKARKLGDRLVVAVNTDSSTKRLKGKDRPINSLEKRMFVLSSLNMVDWVVSFDEDSPQRLIADLLPDILVKGGDYRFRKIDGSQEVLAHGGQVYILDFESGCSTTEVINSLNKR